MGEPATPQRWSIEPPSLVHVSSSSPAVHSSPPTEETLGSSAPMLLPSSPPIPYTPRRKTQRQKKPQHLHRAFLQPHDVPKPKMHAERAPLYPASAKVIEPCEEYKLKSVPSFDFIVDRKTGKASLSRRNRREISLRQQRALESVLNYDSDSDTDDSSPGVNQFGDALAALARTVARSRVSSVQKKQIPLPETPKKMHNPKSELWGSPELTTEFRTPLYCRPQQLPTQTPPGALIREPTYTTGMTPYLPHS